jgi:hypothetical protein
MLIYGNQEKWSSFSPEEWPAAIARQDAFNKKYAQTGELLGAYGLASTPAASAKTRRISRHPTLSWSAPPRTLSRRVTGTTRWRCYLAAAIRRSRRPVR